MATDYSIHMDVKHAPLDLVLDEATVLQPDLLIVPTADLRRPEHPVRPLLVVEILSPHTSSIDRGRKRKLYAEEGVREYWIVDPEAQTIEVLVPEPGSFRAHGMFRPGEVVSSTLFDLDLAVDSVFRP